MIWTLIQKDLLRKIRRPGGFILLVSLPLLFALLLGLIFGPKQKRDGPRPRVRLLVEDRDGSFVSKLLVGAFGQGEMAKVFEATAVDSGQGREQMEEGKGSALLVIPHGFGRDLFKEHPVELLLIKNPSETFAPQIAEEAISTLAEGTERLIRLAAGPLRTIRRHVDSEQEMTTAEVAAVSVQCYLLIRKVETLFFPPALVIREVSAEPGQVTRSMTVYFIYFLAGISIFSLLFLLESLGRDFFVEQENRTLSRQLAGPLGVRGYVASKLLFCFMVGLVAYALMWSAAVLLFGIRIPLGQWFRLAGFVVVLMAALTGIVGLIVALARTIRVAQAIAPAFILYFGMVGGVMIPLGNLPRWLRPLSISSPIYWGQDAVKRLLIDGSSLSAVGRHLGVLGLSALLFWSLTLILFERKYRT